MENINGYQLTCELKDDNSGFSKWGFCKKGGVEFFIKEFLSPIYPLDNDTFSSELIAKKREFCKEFEYKKRVFYNQLNQCITGNVVTVLDFFRSGGRYYIITQKVDATAIDPADVARFEPKQRDLIIKVILHCIGALHKRKIVHGDIKPGNILFKRTATGIYTPKIIDFDSSFLESNPPRGDEELQGDMVYFAPESFMFIAEGGGKLTTKIDVFALGILFHQYFCGELPAFDSSEYDYVFETVLDGGKLTISDKIPARRRDIIASMLAREPEDRPELFEIFAELDIGSEKAHEPARDGSLFMQAGDLL